MDGKRVVVVGSEVGEQDIAFLQQNGFEVRQVESPVPEPDLARVPPTVVSQDDSSAVIRADEQRFSAMNSSAPTPDVTSFLPGGGEMGEQIRAFEWSNTPLGAIETWPQSLRTIVGVVLSSRFPMDVLWGPDLLQIYNDGYRVIAGDKHPQALGRSTREVWAEVWEFNKPIFDAVMSRGESVYLEDQLFPINRYGYPEDAYFTLCYSPIPDDSGGIGGTLVTLLETTERKRVNTAPAGIMIHAADGRVIRCNAAAQEILGLSAEGMDGESRTDEAWPFLRQDGSTMPPAEYPVAQALTRREPVNGLVLGIQRSGTNDVVWVTVDATPRLHPDGSVSEVVASFMDITERKRAEEALEQANRDKTDILESISDCFYALDKELRFIYVNKAAEEIWGLSRADLIDRRIEDVFPDQIDLSLSKFRQVLEEQVPLHYEVYSKVIQRWGDMNAYPTRDGVSVFFQDTTERKRAEEARDRTTALLEAIHSAQSQFIATEHLSGLFTECLEQLLVLMDSEYGFIDELCYTPDGQPFLTALGITDIAWNDESRRSYQQFLDGSLSFAGLKTLFGAVMMSGEPVIANNAERDPRGIGVPPGHPPLRTFLGLPLRSSSGELVGVIGLANRPGGYSRTDIAFLEPLMAVCANIITARRNDQQRQQAEEALRESEENYRALFENAEYGFVVVEPLFDDNGRVSDLRYLQINPAFERQTGLRAADFLAKRLAEALPGIEPHWLGPFDQVVQSGKPVSYEEYNRDTGRWYDVVIFPYSNGLLGEQFIDITERRQVEEALRESEQRFRAICEHGGIGIALGDLEGRLAFVNSAFEKMLGYKGGELIGRNFRDLTCDEDLPEENAYVNELLSGKRSHYRLEKRYLQKDGDAVWVELSGSVLLDSDGNPAFGLAMVLDITARKQAEEALRESEERFRGLIETAEEGIAIHEPDGTITYVNQRMADMLGYSSEEIIGKSSLDFMDSKQRELVIRARDSLRERGSFSHEWELLRKDGSVLWTLANVSPRRDRAGNLIGYLTMHTEITERKQLEQRQRELLEREHRIAQTLQNALVPPELPRNLGGCKIASVYQPASEEADVGGDFYDVFELAEGKIGVIIGDVMGKGLPAAIRVAAARHAIRGHAFITLSPADTLSLANDALVRSGDEDCGMLTAFFAVVDVAKNRITYASAGHERPILRRKDGCVEELECNVGFPLSVVPGNDYSEHACEIQEGDIVVMFTDGVTEARNADIDLLGKSQVKLYLQNHGDRSIDEIADGILDAAKSHASGKLQDDAAILVFTPAAGSDEPNSRQSSEAASKEDSGDVVGISSSGCLTRGFADGFLSSLERAGESACPVTIDLRRVQFMDTSVLNGLAGLAASMCDGGKRLLVLVSEGSYPVELLRLVQFHQIMEIETTPPVGEEENWTPIEEQILTLPDSADGLQKIRKAAYNVAMTTGFSSDESWDITSAVVEACGNALEHGRGGGSATVTVRALSDRFEAVVRDYGDGFICPSSVPIPPPTAMRGRGIPIMKLHMDAVHFASDGGCEVTLVKRMRKASQQDEPSGDLEGE